MANNIDGTADNLVSMFGLNQLNLEEDTTRDINWSLSVDEEDLKAQMEQWQGFAQSIMAEAESKKPQFEEELQSKFENW